MEDFNTIEKAEELFKKEDCFGQENLIFLTFKDVQQGGGMLNGMKYPYDGLLINHTEDGIGMFYLKYEKPFSLKPAESMLLKGDFVFIPKDDIFKIRVKNYNFVKKSVKKVIIDTKDGKSHKLMAHVKEDKIPYHEENFEVFMNLYK